MRNTRRPPLPLHTVLCSLPNAPSIVKVELVNNAISVNVRPGTQKPNSLGEKGPSLACRAEPAAMTAPTAAPPLQASMRTN